MDFSLVLLTEEPGHETPSPTDTPKPTASPTPRSTESPVKYGEDYDDKDGVALYLHLFGELPPHFITKKEAQKLGLTGEAFVPPEGLDLIERILRHARLELLAKGDHGMVELRKHLPLYFTGRRGASALKKALSQVKTMEELERLLLDRDGCGQYNSMN